MPQSAIGGRIGFALAAKDNCTYPADFFPSDQILAADLAEPLLPAKDAADGRQRVRLWSAPGIGVEPERAVLEKFCIARAKIERLIHPLGELCHDCVIATIETAAGRRDDLLAVFAELVPRCAPKRAASNTRP